MADDLEEKPSTSHDIASTKASVLDTLNKLKKWRKEQLEECRNKQYLESQRSLQLSKENQKQFEQLFENSAKFQSSDPEENKKESTPAISNISSISLASDSDNYDTLQESSITGHLQRCFADSPKTNVIVSENKVPHVPEKVPVFSELRNLHFSGKYHVEKQDQQVKDGLTSGTSKLKRPFLRKGSGLRRYMPNSISGQITSSKSPPKITKAQLPKKNLKLKPALRKTDVPEKHIKHIRFDITDFDDEGDVEAETDLHLSPMSKTSENVSINTNVKKSSSSVEYSSPESNKLDTSISGSESLNLSKESKELEEFEMLENCAQNSSFNSDSSIVQKMLQGESTKQSCASQNYFEIPSQNHVIFANKESSKSPSESPFFSEKICLSKCLEEARSRKQKIQEVISEMNPRIESLEKEITRNEKEKILDDNNSERCSTPMSLEDQNRSSVLPECDSNIDLEENSPESHINHFMYNTDEVICPADCGCCNNGALENFYLEENHNENICSNKEESVCDDVDEANENVQCLNRKCKFRSKSLELQKEIEKSRKLNAELSCMCKQRDEILRKLQKEKDDFNKFKETELKKLETQIQEERRQIKRQKETFTRYQKLRKDNPTKKERDELNALRVENEKLQEDLKRQKIKYVNESRRWKNRLDTAERDRDSFKLENIKLEERCEDLLIALKGRMKKINISDNDDIQINKNETVKEIPMSKDAESQTESKDLCCNDSEDSNQMSPKSSDFEKKSKVQSHSVLEHNKNDIEIIHESLDTHAKDSAKGNILPKENNVIHNYNQTGNLEQNIATVNLSEISISSEAEFKEINHGNRLERIYQSGIREIQYNSGTRKVISADGKSRKFFFYNGDVKEIFLDGKEIYEYVNGVTETLYPNGQKVTEFPNGQVQYRYPNGQKKIRFSDGTVHSILADGSEEIHSIDGNVEKRCADGTRITEFANGQKEIRTDTFTRREFPDGSIKIIYDSGRQETRYPNGRVRIKDKEGKVLFDTKYLSIQKR